LQRTLAGDQISLDLFDEAVASVEQDAEVRELDRLDGLVGRPELPSLDELAELSRVSAADLVLPSSDPGAAAAIAEAEAIVRELGVAADDRLVIDA
jgi:hypothetical protein